jgi:hypothetical protein
MKWNNIILKGFTLGVIALFGACSGDYLETNPDQYLEEDAVTETMKNDPSQVQAY